MNRSPAPTGPLLLLAEDDPTSAAFLAAAAGGLPARLVVVDSLAAARAACAAQRFDLLLLDANLADGRGDELLRALRHRGIDTVALAHTADPDADGDARLRAAGFAEVLRKPLAVETLLAALRRHLPGSPGGWDDAAALAALGGQPAHVQALRAMFLEELPSQRARIVAAGKAGDEAQLRADLHRLAASCGFVGAARLGDAVRQLQAAPLDAGLLRSFLKAADEVLQSP